jgi:hypothetical protein
VKADNREIVIRKGNEKQTRADKFDQFEAEK